MLCPYCGSWTRVLATRTSTRRRECANLHRFDTVEVLAPRPLASKGAEPLKDRNKQIFRMWQSGKSMTEVAKSFGLKGHSEVSRIVKRFGGDNQRSHGQNARRANS
jgi:hypothetical protein